MNLKEKYQEGLNEVNAKLEINHSDYRLGALQANKKLLEQFISDLEQFNDTKKVTRLEVIGAEREYVKNNCAISLSYQDDGKTLKVFVAE